MIARAGKPVAILSAYKSAPRKRMLGQFRGQGRLADDFDALPEDIARAFEGDSK